MKLNYMKKKILARINNRKYRRVNTLQASKKSNIFNIKSFFSGKKKKKNF